MGMEIGQRIVSFAPTLDLVAFSQTSNANYTIAKPLLDYRKKVFQQEQTYLNQFREKQGISQIFWSHFTETPLGQQKGSARSGDLHIVREPRAKASDLLTLLHRFAFVLFAYAKTFETSEQEIQCMHIGDKLLITANLGTSVAALYKRFIKTSSEKIADILGSFSGPQFEETDVYQSQALRKREGVFDDISRFQQLAEQAVQLLSANVDLKGCAALLTQSGPKIIFLNPGACHAEQNFVLVLAGLRNPNLGATVIAGKKRPCASCRLTLAMFREFWLNTVEFNPLGGTHFDTADDGVYKLIEVGLKQGKFTFAEIQKWMGVQIGNQRSYTSRSRSSKKNKKRKKDEKVILGSEKGDSGFASESEDDEKIIHQRKKRKKNPEGEDDW